MIHTVSKRETDKQMYRQRERESKRKKKKESQRERKRKRDSDSHEEKSNARGIKRPIEYMKDIKRQKESDRQI